MLKNLGSLNEKVVGLVPYDQELVKTGLLGKALDEYEGLEEVERIVERLEQVVSFREERN